MSKTQLKTKYQIEKEARELAIYNDYNELMKEPGAMSTAVTSHLQKKYNLHAPSSIWQARKRSEERIKKSEIQKLHENGCK